MIIQILILILTFVCYLLTRKLKDNGFRIDIRIGIHGKQNYINKNCKEICRFIHTKRWNKRV